MALNKYDKGDLVRISAVFKNLSDVATDPTTVTLKVKDPAGTTTTYTYAAAQIVKDSTGNYHYDLTVSTSGVWYYRWEGAGVLVVTEEAAMVVKPSQF